MSLAVTHSNPLIMRPYQAADIGRLRAEYAKGLRAVIYQLATGGGKTVVFSNIIAGAVNKSRTVGVLTHRRELITQASAKLDWTGVAHGIMAAGLDRDHDAPVQVMSIQSVINRLGVLPQFDFLVLDECHHAVAETWAALLNSQPKAKILGVTATPVRRDGKGLGVDAGGFFQSIVCGPSVATLTQAGYLAPVTVYEAARKIDTAGLRKVAGDWAAGDEMAARACVVTGDAVAEYQAKAAGKSAVAFCVTVAHAEQVAQAFRDAGLRSACVHGATPKPERDSTLAALGTGGIDVVTACDLISEGLDIPSIGAAILLRPSGSLSLVRQQVGRGMRPKADGSALVVIDHAGNIERHGDIDEDIAWTLDGAVRKPKAAAEAALGLGVGMGKKREVEQVEGALVLREKAEAAARKWRRMTYRTFKGKRRTGAEIAAFAAAKGYKYGWQMKFAREQAEQFSARLPAPLMADQRTDYTTLRGMLTVAFPS